MALVEIEAGPHRVTAAITRDAVEELGLAPGVNGDRDGEGDVGDGRALVKRARRSPSCSRCSAPAGCGCGDDGKPTLRVSAAASLKKAFEDYGSTFDAAKASFSFAGSDELAAQIRKGARPDVFAAANTKLPDQLYAEGLVEQPVPFATNRLVVAVPADGEPRVSSLDDLDDAGRAHRGRFRRPCRSAPTRATCWPARRARRRRRSSDNIRSNEPDVGGRGGQGLAGRRGRRLRLRDGRAGVGRPAAGDRAAGAAAAGRRLRRRGRRRATRTRARRRNSSTAC